MEIRVTYSSIMQINLSILHSTICHFCSRTVCVECKTYTLYIVSYQRPFGFLQHKNFFLLLLKLHLVYGFIFFGQRDPSCCFGRHLQSLSMYFPRFMPSSIPFPANILTIQHSQGDFRQCDSFLCRWLKTKQLLQAWFWLSSGWGAVSTDIGVKEFAFFQKIVVSKVPAWV